MCFSEEASFTAAAALTVVGIFSLKLNKEKRLIPFALVPFFFALQQFNEGLLWIFLPTEPNGWPTFFSQYAYMFFAYLWWPIYIPFALAVGEKEADRKKWIIAFVVLGILQSIYFSMGTEGGSKVSIVNESIQFLPDSGVFPWVYVGIVVIPCIISTIAGSTIFGTLVLLSFLVTQYYYKANFVSVWCYFAAVISLMICWMIWKESKKLRLYPR